MGNELGGGRTVGPHVFTLAVFVLRLDVALFSQRVAKTPNSSWSACLLDRKHSGCTRSSRSLPEVISSQEQQHSGWTAPGHHDSVSQGSVVARHVLHFI